ncbi:MAG: site-2 protease family protein [Nanoarchaeota archaeon]
MVEYVKYDTPKGPKMFKFGRYSFSTLEFKHLTIAFFMITLTIMALQRGFLNQSNQINLVSFIIIFFFSVGLGFLLHELAHKLIAQYYGFISEFRADFFMLFLSFLVASIFHVTFLAPGAVMILGRPTIKQNGKISVAGPLVNLSLALIYILLFVLLSPVPDSFLYILLSVGILVNAFLGIFNMLPFWILDGKKVWAWNKPIYLSVMGLLLLILILFI